MEGEILESELELALNGYALLASPSTGLSEL